MKRLLIATLILFAGATTFRVLQRATQQLQRETSARRETLPNAAALLAEREERDRLEAHVRALKQSIIALPELRDRPWVSYIATNRASSIPPELREKLLEELEFNWKSSSDYLVVSKDTLRNVSWNAIEDDHLSAAAKGVLAITEEESAGINAAIDRIKREHASWFTNNVQRSDPEGNIVAKYTIPADTQFSQTMSNDFARATTVALGKERADLLWENTSSWRSRMEMEAAKPSELVVRRESKPNEDPVYRWTWQSANGSSSVTYMSPYSFPEKFRQLFPNGWVDLAAREGFKLPKEFKKL